jgi:autotransporter translocation and assembly factor TamB
MSTLDRASGERQPRRRGCLGVALRWLLIGLPVLLGAAFLTRERWLTSLIQERAARWALESEGAHLTIGALSGSVLGDLELTGIEWSSETSGLRGLHEGRIRLRYSPWRLLREGVAGLTEVELEAGRLDLGPVEPTGEEQAAPLALSLGFRIDVETLTWAGVPGDPLLVEDLRLEARLAPGQLRIESLAVRSGTNHLKVTDGEVPLDRSSLAALLSRTRGHVALNLPRPTELWPSGAPPWPVENADLELDIAEGRASITGQCRFEGGSVDLQGGGVSLQGDSLTESHLELSLEARIDDLRPIGEALGQPLAGQWEGHVEVQGTPLAPVGRFVGVGSNLQIGPLELQTAELDMTTDGERITLAAATLKGPRASVEGSGSVALHPPTFENLTVEGQVEDPAVLEMLPLPCHGVSGSARLSGPVERPTGTFEVTLEGLEVAGRMWTELHGRGRIDGDEIALDDLTLSAPDLEARAALRIDGWSGNDMGGEIRSLEVQWREARCALVEPAQFSRVPGRLTVEQVVLAGDRGRAHGELELGGPHPHARLVFEAFEAAALAAVFLPPDLVVGPIDGEILAEIADGEMRAGARLTVGGLRWAEDPAEWRLGLSGSLTPARLSIESLTAHSSVGDVLQARGEVPLDTEVAGGLAPGPVAIEVEAEVEDPRALAERLGLPPLEARHLTAGAHLAGSWDRLIGDATVRLSEFVLPGQASLLGPCKLEVRMLAQEDAVALERAEFAFAQGRATGSGTLGRPLDLLAIRDDLDTWLGGALSAEVQLDLPDFGGLERLIGIRRASGSVSGTLSLAGTARSPQATGRVTWRDGELRPTIDSPPVRSISADLKIVDGLVRIERASGELGGAPLSLEGTFDPRRADPELDIRVRGQNVLLQRSERARLRADADLTLRGPISAPLIGGDLILTEGRFYGDIRPLDELLKVGRGSGGTGGGTTRVSFWRDPPLSDARFDVRVRAANAFVVDTNLMEARLRPDCRLSGTGEAPTLSGPVYVEDATLILPSGKMFLQQGVLEFLPKVPFRPEIGLTWRQQSQGYDIRASVTGTLDEFEIALSSTPPLPSDDLYVLVFTGQPPQDRWQDRSTQAMQSVALFLARDQLVRWLARDPDAAESLLERFEVEVGARTSLSGQPTGRVLFYLKPRSARSGRATYLSAEVDRYDRVNYSLGVVFRPR